MDAREPRQPKNHEELMNPADYVDALLRPQPARYAVVTEKIKGRRLRDRYLQEITVVRLVDPGG
jgi:hypothetical protein